MDLVVALSVLATALLSGVFGMAGGVLLLVVLSLRMPLADAMVLHGGAQLIANGARALLSRGHVQRRVVGRFVLGAAAAIALCGVLGIVVDTATAMILTGVVPFLEPLLARMGLPAADTRRGAVASGLTVTTLHLTAGATGPLLDVFFLRTSLSRHQVVGTTAAMQCIGHAAKLVYFGELTQAADLPAWRTWLVLAALSVTGTFAGRLVLDRMGEALFRRGTRLVVSLVGLLSLARGLAAL